ncbi:MAG: HlyD family secretion protein [Bryobacteraceae bacterium]
MATKQSEITAWRAPGSETLPAIEMVGSTNNARTLARFLTFMFLFVTAFIVFTPWQQSVAGAGKVIALTPMERQQTIDAPIEGRVVHWHVIEGTHVKTGDLVAEIADNDPELLGRLKRERAAVAARLDAAQGRVVELADRISQLEESRTNAIAAARSRLEMAIDRLRAAEQAIDIADQRRIAAELNIERQQKLLEKGLTSRRNLELAEQEYRSSVAEVERAKANLNAARNEQLALASDLQKIQNDQSAMVRDARAAYKVAMAEVANAEAELQRQDVRVARQQMQAVMAPRDGTILRLIAQPGGEIVKPGEPVAILVPDTASPVVELFLDGNDVPLVHKGDPVRIQFNGWPAIQFVGWPSVAVGTFGGRVWLVDATDNGSGSFRILVVPDEEDDPWPSNAYLRQGVLANGWVLLKTVPIWFEIWRQFNGFPPVISETEPGASPGKRGKK